jgi:prepilin-type N-terminal cleavage/methylation domain-containing protein
MKATLTNSARAPISQPGSPKKRSTYEAGNEAGFTLIELLVSTTILAFVMALVAIGVQVISDGWERGGRTAAWHDMLSRANDILRRDLRGIRRIVFMVGQKPSFLFAASANTMTYIVQEPAYPTEAALYVVRLSKRRNTNGNEQLIRSRQKYNPGITPSMLKASADRPELADPVVLAEGPFEITLQFNDGQNAANWSDNWTQERRMPALVKVRFRAGAGKASPPDMVVRLSLDAEIGCVGEAASPCTIQTKGQLPEKIEKKEPVDKKKATDPPPRESLSPER